MWIGKNCDENISWINSNVHSPYVQSFLKYLSLEPKNI